MIRLHIVEAPERIHITNTEPEAGAMWRWPANDIEGRECWCVVLPNRAGTWWTTLDASDTGNLWEVTGEPPNITVRPSINYPDSRPGRGWHGHIVNGEMTP